MNFQIFKLLTILICSLTSFSALAITVKDCPSELTISISEPKVAKGYAKALFEDYFTENKVVSNVLKIESKNNSQCNYRSEDSDAKIYFASIRGSLAVRAKEPATLVVYGNLPISAPGLPFELSEIVAYGKIATLSPFAVTFSNAGDFYRVGEICNNGECIMDYIYLGVFEGFRVDAQP